MNSNDDRRFMSKAEHLQWQIQQQQAQLNRLAQQARIVQRPAPAPTPRPRRQSAIKEKLDKMTEHEWAALADKAQPLPDDFARQPEQLLREMGNYLLAMYEAKYGLTAF